jgi:hypothetical protein
MYCTGPSSSECKQCFTNDNRTYNPFMLTCTCMSGFYDDGSSSTCKTCDTSCYTCNAGGPLGCTTCLTSYNRQLSNGACICAFYYYQVGSSLQCTACQYSCQRCAANSATSCTLCDNQFHRTLSDPSSTGKGPCLCDALYFDNGRDLMCANCHYSCSTCQASFSSSCLTCDATTNFRYQVGPGPYQCICSAGYFDNGSTASCQPCHAQCKACNGAGNNKCTQCTDTQNR